MRGVWRRHEACLVALGLVISTGIAAPARADDEERVSTVPSWIRHPGNGLTVDLGLFDGGTDIATTKAANGATVGTITFGSGSQVSIGGMVTPLWIGEYAGFGASAFAAIKYDWLDISGGTVSITRFPLGVAAHVLLHIDRQSWLFFRGGLQKELGVSVSGDSDLGGQADLQGSLGGFGEGGYYGSLDPLAKHLAWSLTFRYSVSHDTIGGTSFSASNGGVILAVHYNFI